MAEAHSRSVFVKVNLDALEHNVRVLRQRCPNPKQTGVIGVVKAAAYGHGSVMVSRHLKHIGVERLAVATIQEGVHLRENGIKGIIHVLGNVQGWEMAECLRHGLIPTVSTTDDIVGMADALKERQHMQNNCEEYAATCTMFDDFLEGSINIKVDTGMSRNGCQPSELCDLVEKCRALSVPLDAIFTHFSDSWGNEEFTKQQLDTFLGVAATYRRQGIKVHVANSGAILQGYGTDLDFIRPGICLYGLPPDDACEEFLAFGLKPVGSVVGHPTLVKALPAGRKVGYSCSYTTKGPEFIATIPLGYADGYWRHLSSKGIVIRNKTGEKCPVVGRVSMDAITIRVPEQIPLTESFTIITDDYDSETSACGIADIVGTIAYEVGTRLSTRFPRIYMTGGKQVLVRALWPESY